LLLDITFIQRAYIKFTSLQRFRSSNMAYTTRALIILSLLCGLVSVCYHVNRVTREPEEHVCMGAVELFRDGAGSPPIISKDNALQLERWAESVHCDTLASKAVQIDHPKLLICDLSVDAAWDLDQPVMRVFAMGSMPNYTRRYLEALLNECVIFARGKNGLLPPDVRIRISIHPETPIKVPQYGPLSITVWWCLGSGGGAILGLILTIVAKLFFGSRWG